MQAYCMKCRAKREIKNAKAVVLKNGRPATQGICPVCGTEVFRIGEIIPRGSDVFGVDKSIPPPGPDFRPPKIHPPGNDVFGVDKTRPPGRGFTIHKGPPTR